uniref:Uncharacterized protein n=1 Tax=Oryza punctata TaxID=4537 RepID=A0A0E0MEG1_ORYPU
MPDKFANEGNNRSGHGWWGGPHKHPPIRSSNNCSHSFDHVRLSRRVCSPSVGATNGTLTSMSSTFCCTVNGILYMFVSSVHFTMEKLHNGTNMPYHAKFRCLGSTPPSQLTILDYLRLLSPPIT